jgi:hypothetical protein
MNMVIGRFGCSSGNVEVTRLAIHDLNYSAKQIFWSDILLVICCVFYLAWWLLAFKPTGAIKGIHTGWLLIPAFITGLTAVTLAVKGIQSKSYDIVLFPSNFIVWGGVAAYLFLFIITGIILKRQVTTELFLIDGWAVLMLLEINELYGMGRFTHGLALIFIALIVVATLISIVCYVLYYNLGSREGYIDGMIPLILAALVMLGISLAIKIN